MCGRTTLTIQPDDLQEAFGFEVPAGYRSRYNIAPSQNLLTIAGSGEERGFRFYRWGLVPFWAKEPSIGNRMINARAETVASKPAFRSAFRSRRCLVVADGFYEWARRRGGKQPYRMRLKTGAPMTFAGLWERWEKGGEPLETCTIITTPANEVVAPIHDRMPVILAPEARWAWLSDDTESSDLEAMLVPYGSDDLEAYEVSTLVNSPANDEPECIEPLPVLDLG